MAVQPASRPCWVVCPEEDPSPHFEKFTDAIQTAADRLDEGLFDDDRVPFVADRCCWQVVCPLCGVPIDSDDGGHFTLAEACEVDEALTAAGAGLCGLCETAVVLGSVAGVGGVLLARPQVSARLVRPGCGQLPLFESVGVA